jgi:hypothetical protein
MYRTKPDYEATKQRMDAFWEREIIDRPLVQFSVLKPPEKRVPQPGGQRDPRRHPTPADLWLDTDYLVESTLANVANNEYLGDSLPIAYPNLGPELFSAFYGCTIHFGDYGTSWTEPILHDWSEVDRLQLDWEHPYLAKLEEMTDALLAAGSELFITGLSDWHPGGDAIAAFRDPQNLALDMVLHKDEVVALLRQLETDYFRVYDHFYNKLKAAGQPITTWINLLSDGRYYVPSNDFSYMISARMFEEVFLPGIANECRFYEHSIYHLDGIGALRHLDLLLSIPELDAVQWVFGAGHEGFAQWVPVYQRIQAAGKGVQVVCDLDEIPAVMETLDPRGLYLTVSNVGTREVGLDLIRRLETWCAGRVHPVR